MEKFCINRFVFKGEIAELVTKDSAVNAKILCKPGTLLIEISNLSDFELGDQVRLSGTFTCEKIENLNNFNTNH